MVIWPFWGGENVSKKRKLHSQVGTFYFHFRKLKFCEGSIYGNPLRVLLLDKVFICATLKSDWR